MFLLRSKRRTNIQLAQSSFLRALIAHQKAHVRLIWKLDFTVIPSLIQDLQRNLFKMTNRPWDPENNFPNAVIAESNYWVSEISYRQHTLGCFIIFCKRNVTHISDLSDEEMVDLKHAMKNMENRLSKSPNFQPDWINYWQMGNSLPWLHFHGIPRYKTPRQYAGQKWVDTEFGHPPIWKRQEEEKDLIVEIRNELS